MTWTKLGDDYADRLEDLELTPTACWLHTAALIYCNRVGSDGRLPFSKIGKVAAIDAVDRHVGELEQQGLWIRDDGDSAWQVDWTDQEPAEDVRKRREGAALRQRRSRQHRAGDHSLCDPQRACSRSVTRDATGGEADSAPPVTRDTTRESRRESRPPVPPVPSRPGPKEPGKGRGHRTTAALRCPIPGHDGRSGVDAEGDPHCGDCADARTTAETADAVRVHAELDDRRASA